MKTQNITIRSITEDDNSSILELIDNCRPYVLPHHEYFYWILEHYYQSTCFVCELDMKLIGFISGLPSIDKKSIFIWQICVHPNFRKLKLGNQMLNKIYNRFTELNFESIQFSIDKNNIPSYKLFEKFAIEKNMVIEAINNNKICSSNEIAYKIYRK